MRSRSSDAHEPESPSRGRGQRFAAPSRSEICLWVFKQPEPWVQSRLISAAVEHLQPANESVRRILVNEMEAALYWLRFGATTVLSPSYGGGCDTALLKKLAGVM